MTDAITHKSGENMDLLRSLILPNIVCYMTKYGYLNFLKELKSYKTDFASPDYDDRTALHIAAREGKLEVVRFLL
jgi:ankyrin repeat protein